MSEPEGGGVEPAHAEANREPGPRIYVASLSDYNAGILHGRWLDATADLEELQAGINQMLADSPTTKRYGDVAEEFAIHDYEGFGPAMPGEYEGLQRVHCLATGIQQHGDAFGAWWNQEERDDADQGDVMSQFENQYVGEFTSLETYGEQILDDMGIDISELPSLPEGLRPYVRIDVEAWTRDMVYGGEIASVESRSGVYVFWPE